MRNGQARWGALVPSAAIAVAKVDRKDSMMRKKGVTVELVAPE